MCSLAQIFSHQSLGRYVVVKRSRGDRMTCSMSAIALLTFPLRAQSLQIVCGLCHRDLNLMMFDVPSSS
eukprot:3121438-Amphidinium_carterae.1